MNHHRLLTIVLALVPAAACGGSAPKPVSPSSVPKDAGNAMAEIPRATAGSPGELHFETQAGWIEERPSNSMRVKQYSLPAAEGDPENAALVVTSGIGGSADANLARWIGQFEQPDGADPMTRATRSVKNRGDLVFHELEISGTFVAEIMSASMMSTGERENKPNWRMLAAVVESPHGPYYVKLVGPDATVRSWRESFQAFLQAIRT